MGIWPDTQGGGGLSGNWKSIEYQNGTTAYGNGWGDPKVALIGDCYFFAGIIGTAVVLNSPTVIGNLPAGMALPSVPRRLLAATNGGIVPIKIDVNGNIILQGTMTDFLALDGVFMKETA